MKITGDPRECEGSLKLLGQDLTCFLIGGKTTTDFLIFCITTIVHGEYIIVIFHCVFIESVYLGDNDYGLLYSELRKKQQRTQWQTSKRPIPPWTTHL